MEKEHEVITVDDGSSENLLSQKTLDKILLKVKEPIDEETETVEKEVKPKRKYKKKNVESFQGKIGSNWVNVRNFMQENNIRYTTPGENAKTFVVQEKKPEVKDAKKLLIAKFGNYI